MDFVTPGRRCRNLSSLYFQRSPHGPSHIVISSNYYIFHEIRARRDDDGGSHGFLDSNVCALCVYDFSIWNFSRVAWAWRCSRSTTCHSTHAHTLTSHKSFRPDNGKIKSISFSLNESLVFPTIFFLAVDVHAIRYVLCQVSNFITSRVPVKVHTHTPFLTAPRGDYVNVWPSTYSLPFSLSYRIVSYFLGRFQYFFHVSNQISKNKPTNTHSHGFSQCVPVIFTQQHSDENIHRKSSAHEEQAPENKLFRKMDFVDDNDDDVGNSRYLSRRKREPNI